MGCDIHMQVQRRVDGTWQTVDQLPARPCSWCGGKGHYEGRPKDSCYSCKGLKIETGPYKNRNYIVFSVLADVRNEGYVKPISGPRGLPTDLVGDDPQEHFGDHSRSWLALKEIQAYDWNQVFEAEGWVSMEEFKVWDANGRGCPQSWSGGVMGSSIRHVSNSEMRRRIKDPYEWEANDSPYTLVRWTYTVKERCKTFLQFVETLPLLCPPEDVRIVFGFDS